MKEVTKEKIEELKKAHPEGVYEGEINFSDEENKPHTVSFIFRKPNSADLESYGKTVQKNAMIANLNIVQQVIIYPETGPIIESIREFPAAYARFVDDVLNPFFGANATAKSKKL
jgi:hypothetical protein